MIEVEKRTLEEVTSPEILTRVEEVREYWAEKTREDVARAAVQDVVDIPATADTSRAIIIKPDSSDIDETETIVLDAPGMNGYYDHIFLRAKVMQQIIAPEKRVVLLPNNGNGQANYDMVNVLTPAQRDAFKKGNMTPLAENRVRTLEGLDQKFSLGRLGLTGYSQGGKMAIQTALAANSSNLDIFGVNSDEAPSKKDRTAFGMSRDFMKSSGNWGEAVNASGVAALDSVLSPTKRLIGMTRFTLVDNMTADAKLMRGGMSGDINFDVYRLAVMNDIALKLGYASDSGVFSPRGIAKNPAFADTDLRIREYYGDGIHQHASGDNIVSHALMVNDGLYPQQPAK